jgi:hypothetical protein
MCSIKKNFLDHMNERKHLKGITEYEAKKIIEKKHVLIESIDTEVKFCIKHINFIIINFLILKYLREVSIVKLL